MFRQLAFLCILIILEDGSQQKDFAFSHNIHVWYIVYLPTFQISHKHPPFMYIGKYTIHGSYGFYNCKLPMFCLPGIQRGEGA